MSRVVLVAACDAEWASVRGTLGVETAPPIGRIVPARGELGLLRVGVGLEPARRSAAALREARPAIVVHVGFAGGLRTGVTAGGLVLVTAVSGGVLAVDGDRDPPPPQPLDAELVDRLRSALARLPDRLAQGALLTVDRFVDRAVHKGALGRSTDYIACEMEAAVVKAACDDVGARYLGVRAISDAEHESVPPVSLTGLLRPAGLAQLGRWAARPAAVVEAYNFVAGGRRAKRALARAIPPSLEVAHAAAAGLR